eukprot:285759-Amphidinium_carterae.1
MKNLKIRSANFRTCPDNFPDLSGSNSAVVSCKLTPPIAIALRLYWDVRDPPHLSKPTKGQRGWSR